MKKALFDNLMKKVDKQQKLYQSGIGQYEYEIMVEHNAPTTTTRYIAIRDDSERGLYYNLYEESISIKEGYKKDFIGYTNEYITMVKIKNQWYRLA